MSAPREAGKKEAGKKRRQEKRIVVQAVLEKRIPTEIYLG